MAANKEKDDTPPRLERLFRTFPDMGEAWEDPLIQHYRETILAAPAIDPRNVAIAAMVSAQILALAIGVFLPYRPGFLTFVLFSTGPVWLALIGYAVAFPPPGDKRFAFLTDLKHDDWRRLPFDPLRAAQLTAMKIVLGRQRQAPLAQGAVYSLGLTSAMYVLFMFLGPCAGFVPFLFMLLLYRIWKVRDFHINESTEAYWIVVRLEKMSEDLHLPPLSQDPSATSEQKRIMYGDWSHMLRASVPNAFGLDQQLMTSMVAMGPHIGGVIMGTMVLCKLAIYAVMLVVLPPGAFAEYIRQRTKGGIDTHTFHSIIANWADLLKRWQDRGMGDPEMRVNAAAIRQMAAAPALTPKEKYLREYR